MTSNLTVRMVTDSKEFESMREVWNELLAKSSDNNIYLTWEWLFTWWKCYGENKKLSILLIEEGDRIAGIVPLMQSRYGKGFIKFDVLENISSTDVDYGGIILTERKEESVTALMTYLERIISSSSNITLRMVQIPEDSEFFILVQKIYPQFSKTLRLDVKTLTACPFIALPATWNEYFSSLSRKRRHNLRRGSKLLQKEHSGEFKKFAGNNDDFARQVQEFYALHQKRWEMENLRGIFSDKKAREFYLEVGRAFLNKGWLDLSFITVDGREASAVYGFKYNKKFYYCFTAYDTNYSKYSIGNLHIMYLIDDAIKSNLTEFDFLIGDEQYKLHWTHLTQNNMKLVLAKRKFLCSNRLLLFHPFMRLYEISKRSLRENYHLYLKKRRQNKRVQND